MYHFTMHDSDATCHANVAHMDIMMCHLVANMAPIKVMMMWQ